MGLQSYFFSYAINFSLVNSDQCFCKYSEVSYTSAFSISLFTYFVSFLFEVIKSTKLHDNIEEQFSKLTDDDLEIIKKISDRGLDVLAVKMVRVITGVGLLEAKTLVSELKNQ